MSDTEDEAHAEAVEMYAGRVLSALGKDSGDEHPTVDVVLSALLYATATVLIVTDVSGEEFTRRLRKAIKDMRRVNRETAS